MKHKIFRGFVRNGILIIHFSSQAATLFAILILEDRKDMTQNFKDINIWNIYTIIGKTILETVQCIDKAEGWSKNRFLSLGENYSSKNYVENFTNFRHWKSLGNKVSPTNFQQIFTLENSRRKFFSDKNAKIEHYRFRRKTF